MAVVPGSVVPGWNYPGGGNYPSWELHVCVGERGVAIVQGVFIRGAIVREAIIQGELSHHHVSVHGLYVSIAHSFSKGSSTVVQRCVSSNLYSNIPGEKWLFL